MCRSLGSVPLIFVIKYDKFLTPACFHISLIIIILLSIWYNVHKTREQHIKMSNEKFVNMKLA